MARACSRHSVGWILQASPAEAGPPANKAKKAKTNTTPVQLSITSMLNPRVTLKSELVLTLLEAI